MKVTLNEKDFTPPYYQSLLNSCVAHELHASQCRHFYDMFVAQYKHYIDDHPLTIPYSSTILFHLGFDFAYNIHLIFEKDKDSVIVLTIKDMDTEETLVLKESKMFTHKYVNTFINVNGIDVYCKMSWDLRDRDHTDSLIRVSNENIFRVINSEYAKDGKIETYDLFDINDNPDIRVNLLFSDMKNSLDIFCSKYFRDGRQMYFCMDKEININTMSGGVVKTTISYYVKLEEEIPTDDNTAHKKICFYSFGALIGFVEIARDIGFDTFHMNGYEKDSNNLVFFIRDSCNGIKRDIMHHALYVYGDSPYELNNYDGSGWHFPVLVFLEDFCKKIINGRIE